MRPSKPTRKGPGISVSAIGKATGGNVPKPVTKSAKPFGTVDKGVYNRTSTGITVATHNVNRPDEKSRLMQGKGSANHKGVD